MAAAVPFLFSVRFPLVARYQGMRAAIALIALCGVARAQQMPCVPCERGDKALEALPDHGVALREAKLSSLGIGSTQITQQQQLVLDDLERSRHALTADIAALDPATYHDVAFALCDPVDSQCVALTGAALTCLAGQCQVFNPLPPNDPPSPPGCDPYVAKVRSPRAGLGFEWASGWQDDRYPVDGRAWSLGFEARRRMFGRFGLVGRLDRSTGRDRAEDANRDGRDDASTGAVTRMYVLGGASYMFGIQHDKDIARYAQLDVLGGYQATLSQSDEDGVAAGVDLSYQWAVARIGVRALQGFDRARDSREVVAHVGFLVGAGPNMNYGAGCGNETRSETKWAIAFDLPLFGYGLSSKLDYVVPGFGLEGAYHLGGMFDLMTRVDLLDIPNSDRDRAIYQSVLAGGRIDFMPDRETGTRTGFLTTLMVGYSHAATVEPTTAGSGPVLDASLGWGGQGDDGGGFIRLHGRFGLTPDNADARAVFLSAGLEYRLDRRKWEDRN
jgi:hypothetical protein